MEAATARINRCLIDALLSEETPPARGFLFAIVRVPRANMLMVVG
jgi:hypothetical protein